MRGLEWIVDAQGCTPSALRDVVRLEALFARVIADMRLTPVQPPVWHVFPSPGGVTGVVVLAESHLACHTFPEYGSICLNLFCCRPRDGFDAAALLRELLGASEVAIRQFERSYAPVGVVPA
jgi:S-adenosylmethionine decarboxylase